MNRPAHMIPCTALLAMLSAAGAADSETWTLNSLQSIGGHSVKAEGTPKAVQTEYGEAMSFDGDGDRLLVNGNPFGDATAYTLEVIFKPESHSEANNAPRFLHIEDSKDPQLRRVIFELRFNSKGEWAFDGGMTTDAGYLALFDASLAHAGGQWAHVAVTYDGAVMKTFVNGKQELSGKIAHKGRILDASAVASVGARMTRQYWMLGLIQTIKLTRAALEPKDFLTLGGSSAVLGRKRPLRGYLGIPAFGSEPSQGVFTLAGKTRATGIRPAVQAYFLPIPKDR